MVRFYNQLDAIEDEDERQRVAMFIASFERSFGTKPAYVVRSPGRINLIGDHVDYHGFSVLPMAIKNSILLGCTFAPASTSGDTKVNAISIRNKDSTSYPAFHGHHSFAYGSQLDKSHQWHHYVLCGYHGILASDLLDVEPNQIFKHAKDIVKHEANSTRPCVKEDELLARLNTDLKLFVDSNLPPASGLSSSSALVCAAALTTKLFLHSNHLLQDQRSEMNSKSLAELCSKFEHLIGTHGGGMDQAVIITAQEGYAKHVEFVPQFSCNNVRLPDSVIWLVSHCGSSYPKAATLGFNSRVLETKLAAAIIVRTLRPSSEIELDHTIILSRVKDEVFANMSAAEISYILREKVFKGAHELAIEDICARLDIPRADLLRRFKTDDEFLMKSGLDKRVCLLKRSEHVFEEAERVERFKLICDTTRDIHELGKLMSDSHKSLRDKYECSHPDLDKLVKISLDTGALGARLTGAGWGGCIVTMVESRKCDKVLNELKKFSKFTFQSEPQSGCTIIRV